MARKPKGSLFRSVPDYYVDQLMFGGWYDVQTTNAQYGDIGLFNNDGGGRRLYVYGLTITSDTADVGYLVTYSSATGSNVASCSNIDPSKGGGVGQIYLRRFGAAEPPYVHVAQPANTVQVIDLANFQTASSLSGPIAIVPPGYQLSIVSDTQSNRYAVGFWFLPL